MKIKILIPVYNDWQSVSKLIDEINDLSKNLESQISIIIIMMHQLMIILLKIKI